MIKKLIIGLCMLLLLVGCQNSYVSCKLDCTEICMKDKNYDGSFLENQVMKDKYLEECYEKCYYECNPSKRPQNSGG